MKEHISDLRLEKLALGELPNEEEERLRQALASSPEAQARLEALGDGGLFDRLPPETFRSEVQRRLGCQESREEPERRPTAALGWGVLAAVAGLALFVGLPKQNMEAVTVEKGGVRTKGVAPTLVAHRVGGERSGRLESGQQAEKGDRIQLGAMGAAGRYAVIVSIDGRGQATLHHPQHRTGAPLEESPFPLPSSFELDDAPEYERFFLVTGEQPLETAAVMQSARELAETDKAEEGALNGLPAGTQQSSLLLRKPRG
jgi:hypothetical protein